MSSTTNHDHQNPSRARVLKARQNSLSCLGAAFDFRLGSAQPRSQGLSSLPPLSADYILLLWYSLLENFILISILSL